MSFSFIPGFNQRYPLDPGRDPLLDAGARSQPALESPVRLRASPGVLFIEACCTSLEQAVSAQSRGAGRVELCADLSVGGLTPPRDLVRDVVAVLSIPVNVLIRPPVLRSGTQADRDFSAEDFVYDEAVLERMAGDIAYCKSVGAAGIVTGALTPGGAVDLPSMRRLIDAARPLPVTFHRAFDVCTEDPFAALDKIIALGCARLLSSGRAPTAWDGRKLLGLLVRRAGNRIVVMPGCGITPTKLRDLAVDTCAREFHGTRIP